MKIRLSDHALEDIENCLFWSATNFGPTASSHYRDLIRLSLLILASDPEPIGSREFENGIRLYHLRLTKQPKETRVKNPRHFIAYQSSDEQNIDVLRILDDRMDIDGQLSGQPA